MCVLQKLCYPGIFYLFFASKSSLLPVPNTFSSVFLSPSNRNLRSFSWAEDGTWAAATQEGEEAAPTKQQKTATESCELSNAMFACCIAYGHSNCGIRDTIPLHSQLEMPRRSHQAWCMASRVSVGVRTNTAAGVHSERVCTRFIPIASKAT